MRVFFALLFVTISFSPEARAMCETTHPLKAIFAGPESLKRLGEEVAELQRRFDQGETGVYREWIEKRDLFTLSFKERVRAHYQNLHFKKMNAAEKAVEWRKAAAELTYIKKTWGMEEIPSVHGQYFFWGKGGFTILIDRDGSIYRGMEVSRYKDHLPLSLIHPVEEGFIRADLK